MRILRLMAFALVLSSAAAFAEQSVHYSLLQDPPRALPRKVVILPVDITVKELSAGGVVEKVPGWSAEATKVVTDALALSTRERQDIEIVPMPALNDEERQMLDEYLAGYEAIGANALVLTRFGGDAWKHKREQFDYTLGEGLRFLKDKTGADAALITFGEDVVSSGGRKAAFVLAAALLGAAIPMGYSVISLGVLDLNNGDILWMHYDVSGVVEFRDPTGANEMVAGILKAYPGLDAKRAK